VEIRGGEVNLMNFWADERRMPDILLQLLNIQDLPEDLRREILRAYNEVEESGAVTYSTKTRVEHYLHKHQQYLSELFEKSEEG